MSDYDFSKLAEIVSHGQNAPVEVALVVRFAKEVEKYSIYHSLFGTYLADKFPGCSKETLSAFDEALSKAMTRTGRNLKKGYELVFCYLESKCLVVLKSGEVLHEPLLAHCLLALYLEPTCSITPDLPKGFSTFVGNLPRDHDMI